MPYAKYEIALFENNKSLAKELAQKVSDARLSGEWGEACLLLGYPYSNAFTEGVMNTHFRRVLVDLKLLSCFGKHTFTYFSEQENVERYKRNIKRVY
jgi:hypothetical protein